MKSAATANKTVNTPNVHRAHSGRLAAQCLILAAAAIFAVAAVGCGKKPEKPANANKTAAKSSKRITIVVIPKGTTSEFWKSVHAGAVKGKKKFAVKASWNGPEKEGDCQAQIKIVENCITSGVSGIVLAPVDDTALQAPVSAARKAGIQVIIMDSGMKGADCVSYVATDNLKGGKMAGEHLAKLLGGKGKVIMLRYQENSPGTMQRETGFLEAMKANPGIEVVSANIYGGATADSALQASDALLAPYKKDGKLTVDGIFCPNESTTSGMLLSLQNAKLAGSVRFVGFDTSENLVAALKARELDGLILQNPFRMGFLGVKTLAAHIRGEKVEKQIDAGTTLATRENMGEENVAELLKPDLSKWLD